MKAQARQSELNRILAAENAYRRRGVPRGVRIQHIPQGVSGGPLKTEQINLRSSRRGAIAAARQKRKSTPECLALARKLLKQGLTAHRVSIQVGVAPCTIRAWQEKGWLGK